MWFKKLIVNITIKILEKIKKVNFGLLAKVIDELLDRAINTLKKVIENWEIIKDEAKK